ncbi:MAG: DUF5060 domain-containing protein [Phycisphaerae bacterium]
MKQTIVNRARRGRCLLQLAALAVLAASGPAMALEVKVTQNTTRLMPYQVFELTFQHDGKYRNPTWDVTIEVRLASPTGKRYTVGGFFYGSSRPQKPIIRPFKDEKDGIRKTAIWPCDPADLWKARYAPGELGGW